MGVVVVGCSWLPPHAVVVVNNWSSFLLEEAGLQTCNELCWWSERYNANNEGCVLYYNKKFKNFASYIHLMSDSYNNKIFSSFSTTSRHRNARCKSEVEIIICNTGQCMIDKRILLLTFDDRLGWRIYYRKEYVRSSLLMSEQKTVTSRGMKMAGTAGIDTRTVEARLCGDAIKTLS
jgi:hypothetical protein